MDGVQLRGELDIRNRQWQGQVMASAAASGTAWSSDGSFNGIGWIGGGMVADTTSWAGKTWSGKTWSGKTWSGNTWSGKTWSGKTWSSSVWNGSGWSSASWSNPVAATALNARLWSGASWR
jgi:serine protease AprX